MLFWGYVSPFHSSEKPVRGGSREQARLKAGAEAAQAGSWHSPILLCTLGIAKPVALLLFLCIILRAELSSNVQSLGCEAVLAVARSPSTPAAHVKRADSSYEPQGLQRKRSSSTLSVWRVARGDKDPALAAVTQPCELKSPLQCCCSCLLAAIPRLVCWKRIQ